MFADFVMIKQKMLIYRCKLRFFIFRKPRHQKLKFKLIIVQKDFTKTLFHEQREYAAGRILKAQRFGGLYWSNAFSR